MSATATATKPTSVPVKPPKAWFANPQLTKPTPLVVEESGRVYGHLATWDSCHTESAGLGSSCVRAPRSRNGYANFMLGSVLTAEGDEVATGPLVVGGPHADPAWNARATMEHYSSTSLAAADVRVYEDRVGIAVAGALRPSATPEQVRVLRGSPLSGDWRRDPHTGGLELTCALAVNAPGFRVPRPQALIASAGAITSLFAVGALRRPEADRELRFMKVRVEQSRRFARPEPEPRSIGDLRPLMERMRAGQTKALVASMGAPDANVQAWQGVLGFEGIPTGDGRVIDAGALSAASYPMPLRWAPIDTGGHNGAIIVGRIDSVIRGDDGTIFGYGLIDLGSPEGQECARLIAGGFLSGVSVDLDDVDSQPLYAPNPADSPTTTDQGPELLATSRARLRAATLVAIPAFDGARIELVGKPGPDTEPPRPIPAPDSGEPLDSGQPEDSGEPEDSGDCGCSGPLDVILEDNTTPTSARKPIPARSNS